MTEYLVRTCLKCGYSFKSRADVVHPKCSQCASSRVVLAKEMPEQKLNSLEIQKLKDVIATLEIDKLQDVIAGLEHRIENIDGNVRVAFRKFDVKINSNSKNINNIGERLKRVGA